MDKQRIALVGSLVIAVVVIVGAVYLTAKGVPLPAWLAGLVAAVGMAVAAFMRPPGSGGDAAGKLGAVALVIGVALVPTGCASWWARTPQHVGDVAAILACVGEKTEQGHDAASVALACGLENADRVLDLLKVHKSLAARSAAKAAASSSKGLP